jgi:hypothetical protein
MGIPGKDTWSCRSTGRPTSRSREWGAVAFNAAHDAALLATGSPHSDVCLAPTVIP